MTTDILKRDEVIKVQFGNFPSTITSDKIHKSSCYLRKIYIYDIPLSQGGSAHHPIIAVFSRILQISHKKYVSMTNVDCKFLTNILPFYFNINFLKIFTGTKDSLIMPEASKHCHLKIHYLIFYFQIVLQGCNFCK